MLRGILMPPVIMQNTRLTNLIDGTFERSTRWLRNPWRRLSVLIISVLLGNFTATVISTTTGQSAEWDVVVAAILVAFAELVSWLQYGRFSRRDRRPESIQRSLFQEMLNGLKIGIIYGLFVEAFKLGS